ncbi:MAG: hypothetical protein EXR72_03925 [Myxococcales bacterium]|nr:hypothetical protein [Myxococcales bacterium]
MKLDSHDLAALAEQYRTPFYLYDMDAALAHFARLRGQLPDEVELLYCVKANANRRVLASYLAHAQGLDVSSAGEIDCAVAAGFSPSVVSFAGPGKSDDELERAIRHGIRLLSIESPSELRRAARIAERLERVVDITLRVNPLTAPREFPMKMGGISSQFGIPEEEIDPAVELALRTPGIRLRGFHIFSGTNCLDAAAVLANVEQTIAIAARIAERHDLAPEVVNLGGGFGIPYFAGQEALDEPAVTRGMGELLARYRRGRLANTRFLLELGRYLIGRFGVYVARVIDVKVARGNRFVILDGGMNHCFPATGNFGQLIKKNYPVQNLSGAGRESCAQEICGPLCTPIDSMARALESPRAEEGDLIAFLNTGAYCYSASPLLFLGHDTPPEIVCSGGRYEVARARRPTSQF